MTENELEKEVMEICAKPRKEKGIYRKTKKKFSNLKHKDFHDLLLKLIYQGCLEATTDWRLKTSNPAQPL